MSGSQDYVGKVSGSQGYVGKLNGLQDYVGKVSGLDGSMRGKRFSESIFATIFKQNKKKSYLCITDYSSR